MEHLCELDERSSELTSVNDNASIRSTISTIALQAGRVRHSPRAFSARFSKRKDWRRRIFRDRLDEDTVSEPSHVRIVPKSS